ncbi:MAG: hypothetical protein BGO57_08155 [Sphingomonadales bacterium 63-6]|nr:MAG: hypothetical protein BGO57_08155 [Sphingomonadales bacterium 63-6]
MTFTDPRGHLYADGKLSPEEAQALARKTLAQCDDGELYLQFVASESFAFDDGRLKTADYSRDSGFGLGRAIERPGGLDRQNLALRHADRRVFELPLHAFKVPAQLFDRRRRLGEHGEGSRQHEYRRREEGASIPHKLMPAYLLPLREKVAGTAG